ncbi:hypothetical protein [Occultella kanbiaonis]|uniref:hypothetical protein n=1 Tax=Occultella kanbiaonis TaxID=2675754 RepID=UPI0013D8DE70|nr:hypothetical protein [Occultella kanbiaonis]
MPKSKTRKKKKNAGPRPQRPRASVDHLGRMASGPEPEWFEEATQRVLDAAGRLAEVDDDAGLEDAVGHLLGAELRWAIDNPRSGLWFEGWFGHLSRRAVARAKGTEDPAHRIAVLRLLHGMLSQAPTDLLTRRATTMPRSAASRVGRTRKSGVPPGC